MSIHFRLTLDLQSRRPVGMTIEDGAFYLVTVDEEWGDGRFERLDIDDDASSIQTLRSLPFKPRSVAFDGAQFWVADRNNHAIVSITGESLQSSPRWSR